MKKSELNKYYWAAIIAPISKAMCKPAQSAHKTLKWKFISSPFASTSKMSESEFSDYLEQCRDYAKKTYGLDISLPTNQNEND